MSLRTDWPCWEIMKCNPENADQCPAFKSKKPCWEVMRKLDTYSFNICRDCIVYLVKQKDSIFSQEEIQSIMNQKGLVASELSCPHLPSPREHTFAE